MSRNSNKNKGLRRAASLPLAGVVLLIAGLALAGCAVLPQAPDALPPTEPPASISAAQASTATLPPPPSATPTPIPPDAGSAAGVQIPVTGATATSTPLPADPSLSGRISFWAELEEPDKWAVYAYDLASGSAERLTAYVQTFDGFVEPEKQWTNFTGYEYVWSPNGKLLAVDVLELDSNIIEVYDTENPAEAPAPYLVLSGREPSFHPQTYRMAYIDNGINTIITDGTVPLKLSYSDCHQLLYSPSEDYILCEGNFINNGEFYFYAVFEYEFTRISYINSEHLIFPKFSPDGRYLSFFNIQFLERKLTLIDITSREFPQTNIADKFAINQKDAIDFAWHPDSQHIALIEALDAPGEFGITVFQIDSGEVLYRSKPGKIENVSWSPDGRLLAYREVNGGSGDSLVILDAGNGFKVIQRIKFGGAIWYPVWIPEQAEP